MTTLMFTWVALVAKAMKRGELFLLQLLEGVRRRRFLFEHRGSDGTSSSDRVFTCHVCGAELPADPEQAAEHVSACEAQQVSQEEGGRGRGSIAA